MAEWSAYDFTILGRNSASVTEVTHVAHIPDARKIADDGQVTARPIYDESRLNKTRVHVSWVSGNTWSNGSIYGTVEFAFSWDRLISGKEIYWIEAIDYRPTAFRFLITDRGRPSIPQAVLYDPDVDDGPLKRRGSDWFRNSALTSEFMIEDNLAISFCQKITFVQHHSNICRLKGNSCHEKEFTWVKSAALFVGYLIGTRNTTLNSLITPDVGLPKGRLSTTMLRGAASGLYFGIAGKKSRFTGHIGAGKEARYLFRASALQFAMGDTSGAHKTASLLASQETFEVAMNEVLERHFEVPAADFSD
ncbi:hypothetical protein CR492_17685 [Methylocella silvestris]|uniref:Uncharacterized protein n=2 Tax=Methylocella silvestris TaxID=199596 RepID=A0A2J7TD43_METSI|nr:hypothetical protein CR492_17685 [Methylocella silvestris]